MQVNIGPISHSTESPSSTPCEHPGALYPLAPFSPQADACPSPEMAGLGSHACPLFSGMTPVPGEMLWLFHRIRSFVKDIVRRDPTEMDPRDQARLLRLDHGGYGQNFGNNSLSGYGGGGASSTPPTAQRSEWYYQRNATNNGVATSPATYPRQPGTNTNFASPRRDPKSPATQEL